MRHKFLDHSFHRLGCSILIAFVLLTSAALPAYAETEEVKKDEVKRDEVKLEFGIYTSDKPTNLHAQFKPALLNLENTLSKELNKSVRIRLKIFQTYDQARLALVRNLIDFARLGASSYVIAREENPKIKILAIEEEEGGYMRKGVIFTRRGTKIKTVEDLKGRTFAFGDPNSTAGRYLPQAFLVDAGILGKDLKKYEYLNRHDKVCEAVISGEFDAGTTAETIFNKYENQGLVPIVTFDNLTKPWVAAGNMDPTIEKALRNSLVNLKDPKILAAIDKKTTGFFAGTDKLFDPVKAAMEKSDKFSSPAELADKTK